MIFYGFGVPLDTNPLDQPLDSTRFESLVRSGPRSTLIYSVGPFPQEVRINSLEGR